MSKVPFAASLLVLSLDAAAVVTPPVVIHAPSDDGIPHIVDFQIGATGPHTLNLWMVTGPTPTPSVSTQQVCWNGVGDESCGLYAVVTTTGGITITSFNPESGVGWNLVSPNEGRIVKLAASEPSPGDIGMVRLGTLTVNRASDGDVILSSASNYVRSDLVLTGLVEDTIAVPEPSRWLLLPSALGLLALLHRLRRRRVAAAALLVPVFVLAVAPAEAQLYLDRTGFENAIGPGWSIEDFESVVLDGNGYMGFSNGALFGAGAFTWESLATAMDIDLLFNSGTDTGHDGTLLVLVLGTKVGLPGGDFSGCPEACDDFELEFGTPVDAAAIRILGNGAAAGETIEFLDVNGAVLASRALPHGDSFIGYVAMPGQLPIAKIRVDEDNGGDDIRFDDVIWQHKVEISADPILPRAQLQEWRQIASDDVLYGANDRFGVSAAGLGDHDGDGVPDVVVGAHGDDDDGTDRGSVWILFMQREGTVGRVQKISDTAGALSGSGNSGGVLSNADRFGRGVGSLGDLDGDNVGDIVVGTEQTSAPGDVYVLFLEPDGEVAPALRRAIRRSWGWTAWR